MQETDFFGLLFSGQHAEAYANMGKTYLLKHDWSKAYQAFARSHYLRRGTAYNEVVGLRTAQPVPMNQQIITGIHKLEHDIEQIEYLMDIGALPLVYKQTIAAYRELKEELESYPGDYLVYQLTPEQIKKIAATYARSIYQEPAPAVSDCALNPKLDFSALQTEYFEHDPGWVYFDHFLTPEALNRLYQFCLKSTFWHDYAKSAGFLGAHIHDGLNCELLYQIAHELRCQFPKILGHLPLTHIWSFKCDSHRQALEIHADAAAVNVNFWLTPDDANLNQNTGGLEVYDVPAPQDWNFYQYNVDTAGMYTYLRQKKSQSMSIPYRQNRVLIFNPSILHKSDNPEFKDGYPNRRINVTMLFGYRPI